MKNYYQNTIDCINRYNQIINVIKNSPVETTNGDDEFLDNFCIYLAHALIKDHGTGQLSREELCKVADIINDVCR